MASARKIIDNPMALQILELIEMETSGHLMDDFFRINSTAWETRGIPPSQFVSSLTIKAAAESGCDSLKVAFKDMGINADIDIFVMEARSVPGKFRIIVEKILFDQCNTMDPIATHLMKLKNKNETYLDEMNKGNQIGFFSGAEKIVLSSHCIFNDRIDALLKTMGYKENEATSSSSMKP
jgi:hypothetical protein